MKKKFNLAANPIFEYRVTMNENILGDTQEQQYKAAFDRADLFALMINGWAVGNKSKQQTLFDAAVPQAPKENGHEKTSSPVIKVFTTPAIMRKLQSDFKHRIGSIERLVKWDGKERKRSFYAWKHPRGKKAENKKSQTSAAEHNGYT